MLNFAGYDVLKELPGYRAILKAVLKSQIQFLLEQLSQETEEETVLLSASTADGTLSHLSSEHAEDFLQGKDDIKFQFLNHCLKKKHLAATQDLNNDDGSNQSSVTQNTDRPDYVLEDSQMSQNDIPSNIPAVWHPAPDTITVNALEKSPPSNKLPKIPDGSASENTEFSDTLTVDGEKLIVHSNPVKRKRKRKPMYIPNSQRHKASETISNENTESEENYYKFSEHVPAPSKLVEAEENNYMIDKNVITPSAELDSSFGRPEEMSIKTEPTDEPISECTETLPVEDPSSTNDGISQYDLALFAQDKSFQPSFANEIPQQGCSDDSSYYNVMDEGDNTSINPAEMYKAKVRKLYNIQLEEGERPFKCPTCSRCFKLRHHLQNHFSVHSGQRKYECDVCNKTFMRRGTMQIHRRIHTRDTPYKCEDCQISFTKRDRLIYHKCSPIMNMEGQEQLDDSQMSDKEEEESDYSQQSDTSYAK